MTGPGGEPEPGRDGGQPDGADPRAERLTHVRADGSAHMVDVSAKAVTSREATAEGFVRMDAATLALALSGDAKKGDVRAVAEIAGIMAAKKCPDLVPLCHPIAISRVAVEFSIGESEIGIEATVATADRTGVEMEALTAVAVAGLALHDMIKSVDPAAVLDAVRVERKEGGKTGLWGRPEER